VIAAILTVAFLPIRNPTPASGLDSSWQLGLSLVHLHHIPAGPGFVFTYGPLGFLAYPNFVWLPGALLGLLYVVVSTFAFYSLAYRRFLTWLSPIAATVLTAALAMVTTRVISVSEVATAALILWTAALVEPAVLDDAPRAWVVPVLGFAAAFQLLVKFGPGSTALVVAVVVAMARPGRRTNVARLLLSLVLSFLVLWLAAQQSLANIDLWLRESLQLAAGYSAAMATYAGFGGARYWWFWMVAVVVLALGVWGLAREHRARAIPTIVIIGVATWYLTKEGLTRLDQVHVGVAYIFLGALIAAVPWKRRWRPLGIAGLVVSCAAVVATTVGVGYRAQLVNLAEPQHRLGEVGRVIRSAVQPGYRSRELDQARFRLAIQYRMPQRLVNELRNRKVHADPWSITAVWAYGLRWTPAPVFQTYSAYSRALDERNAASLLASSGPDAVVREQGPIRAIGRVPAWESPDYMVALTCDFRMVDQSPRWQILLRGDRHLRSAASDEHAGAPGRSVGDRPRGPRCRRHHRRHVRLSAVAPRTGENDAGQAFGTPARRD